MLLDTAFSVARGRHHENFQILNILHLTILNVSAEPNLTETCFCFHKKVSSPLKPAFWKWPPGKINCPPLP